MGMGMIGRALAAGVGGGLEATGNMMGRQIINQMDEEKARRIAEFNSQMRRDDKTWEMDESEKRQSAQLLKTDTRAKEIAGSRVTNTPEDIAQADAAAQAYNDAKQKGLINQEDADLGYGGAQDFLKRNETKNEKVSDEDYLTAARDTGAISTKDYLSSKSKDSANEMKLLIAQGKFENAIQIAQMKGDFGMLLGQIKAESAGGSEKATEIMRNWKFLESKGYSQADIANKLLEGKVGEYETTETERENPDGSKTKTVRKSKPGEAPPAAPTGKQFKWTPQGIVPR